MTCPVNVSLSGSYPDGRARRRGQEPAEPPQVRGISVGFSASTTGTPSRATPEPNPLVRGAAVDAPTAPKASEASRGPKQARERDNRAHADPVSVGDPVFGFLLG